MVKSQLLHYWSIVAGTVGIISWGLGGLFQLTGITFIFPFWHYWVDGGALILIAIWLNLSASWHKQSQ